MPDFEPFDIHIPGQRVRDRRIAASDIVISDSQSARARYLRQNPDCMRPPSARADDLECPSSVRWIFPRSSTVRRYAERHIRSDDDLSFDFRGNDADRPTSSITTIVLHATSSGLCRPESILEGDDDDIAARSRIDTIAAHFVVLCDATIVYTHDVQYEINGPGLSVAIQIEFDGRFPNTLEPPEDMSSRPSDAMLRAGRALVAAIKARIPSVGWIHPHGQIQVGARAKCIVARARTSGSTWASMRTPHSDSAPKLKRRTLSSTARSDAIRTPGGRSTSVCGTQRTAATSDYHRCASSGTSS